MLVKLCSKCGKEKVNGRCQPCKSEQRRKRLAEQRAASGLPPIDSGREAHCDVCLKRVSENEDIRGEVCYECQKIARRKRNEAKRIENGILPKSDKCLKCGELKTDGRCLPCNNKVKQANRVERNRIKRQEQGKRAWGTREISPCVTCGKEKESPGKSYCNECINTKDRERYLSKRAETNVRPITILCECGNEKESTRKVYCNACLISKRKEQAKLAAREHRASADYKAPQRSIFCSGCKGIKENQNSGYCNACERERYLLKRKPDCSSCGAIKENIRDSYCHECKRNRLRVLSKLKGKLPHNMELVIKRTTCPSCLESGINEECMDCDFLRDEERKHRAAVRKLTRNKIKQGVLTKKPCEICGTEDDVHAHHDDYNKPFDVRWLCRYHHREYHYNNPI